MKKIFVLALAVTMVFSLAACSGTSQSASTSGAPSAAASAAADEYPNKAVSVIVPFSAGGGTDLCTRAIVDAAKDSFPKGIAVENKTGGSGAVGLVAGANAAKDGSVLTTICVELTTLPHTAAGATLSPDQFTPILTMNSTYSAVTVRADSPYNTLEDLLNDAKTKQLQIGNSGIGAIWHLAAAGLAKEAGVEFVHVPFEGAAPAVTSLLGGHIDAITVSYPEVAAQVEAGKLKVLALMSPKRNAKLPDVPTVKELGYDVVIGTWRGLAVPAGTPDEIVDKLYEIFSAASEADSFIEFMNNNNLDIDVIAKEDFKNKIDSEYELFGKLIGELGLGK